MLAPNLTIIIPLLTAFLTGALGLLGLVMAKESKVSEFRQNWIDALRQETADLLAASHHSIAIINATPDGEAIDTKELSKPLREANTALFLIRLRLNPNEPKAASFLHLLDEIETFSGGDDFDPAKINELEKKLVAEAKPVLKEAWLRVRGGEKAYRYARNTAVVIVLLIMVAVVVLLVRPDMGLTGVASSAVGSTGRTQVVVTQYVECGPPHEKLRTISRAPHAGSLSRQHRAPLSCVR